MPDFEVHATFSTTAMIELVIVLKKHIKDIFV
jgi:hypothetical protein